MEVVDLDSVFLAEGKSSPWPEVPAFFLGPNGLARPTHPKKSITLEDWMVIGRKLAELRRRVHWATGDWLILGEELFGEKCYQALGEMSGFQVESLRNDKYVAGRFEPARRRPTLSWTHHQAVASLPRDDADMWLEAAERRKLTVRELREAVKTFPKHVSEIPTAKAAWQEQTEDETEPTVEVIFDKPQKGLAVSTATTREDLVIANITPPKLDTVREALIHAPLPLPAALWASKTDVTAWMKRYETWFTSRAQVIAATMPDAKA